VKAALGVALGLAVIVALWWPAAHAQSSLCAPEPYAFVPPKAGPAAFVWSDDPITWVNPKSKAGHMFSPPIPPGKALLLRNASISVRDVIVPAQYFLEHVVVAPDKMVGGVEKAGYTYIGIASRDIVVAGTGGTPTLTFAAPSNYLVLAGESLAARTFGGSVMRLSFSGFLYDLACAGELLRA
jgi:hypothetical protein